MERKEQWISPNFFVQDRDNGLQLKKKVGPSFRENEQVSFPYNR